MFLFSGLGASASPGHLPGAGALGGPRGMVQGGVGGGFRVGNTCTPMADSC